MRVLVVDAHDDSREVLALMLNIYGAEVVTAMFDGARRLPEQRVSLLLRINPRRYDPAHVATIHRLLAVPAEAGDADLLDQAAVDTLRNGGAVFTLSREDLPLGAQAAAVLRY